VPKQGTPARVWIGGRGNRGGKKKKEKRGSERGGPGKHTGNSKLDEQDGERPTKGAGEKETTWGLGTSRHGCKLGGGEKSPRKAVDDKKSRRRA